MPNSYLETQVIAALIEDHFDDLNESQVITPAQFNKSKSRVKIFNAINNADIECCRLIKQQKQIVIFAKEGTQEIFLHSNDPDMNPLFSDQGEERLEEFEEIDSVFLNREWFLDASQIRSEYIHAYTEFPIGSVAPSYKIKVMSQDSFDESLNDGYVNARHGHMNFALFEPASKRLRFNAPLPQDTFLSFPAIIVPSKLGIAGCGKYKYSQYNIKSPFYAENFLVLTAMMNLLPLGNPVRRDLGNELMRVRTELFAHIPANTSVLEVTEGYIG